MRKSLIFFLCLCVSTVFFIYIEENAVVNSKCQLTYPTIIQFAIIGLAWWRKNELEIDVWTKWFANWRANFVCLDKRLQ